MFWLVCVHVVEGEAQSKAVGADDFQSSSPSTHVSRLGLRTCKCESSGPCRSSACAGSRASSTSLLVNPYDVVCKRVVVLTTCEGQAALHQRGDTRLPRGLRNLSEMTIQRSCLHSEEVK